MARRGLDILRSQPIMGGAFCWSGGECPFFLTDFQRCRYGGHDGMTAVVFGL
jgi:hypothetical protein